MIEQQTVPPGAENIPTDILWRISGRLTALFVHEINNDLATLREKAGFADDVLAARKISDADKLKSMSEVVRACESRLNQAVRLVRSLSDIGRDMESDSGATDIGSTLTALTPFFEKMARQRRLSLRMAAVPGLFVVAAKPYPLLCCILALFDNQCHHSVPGESIIVETRQDSSAVILSICTRRGKDPAEEGQPWTGAELSTLTGDLGISPQYTEEGDRVSLSLRRC